MIELFGSIASILGFTLQIEDQVTTRRQPESLIIGGLLALSQSTKSWKELHSVYHPLGKNFDGIVGELSTYKNGKQVPRAVGEVAPEQLRHLFFDGVINEAIYNFHSRTRREIKDITSSLKLDEPEVQSHMRSVSKFNRRIADEIEELYERKKEALEIHARFLEFLAVLKKFITDPSWEESHVRYLMDQRPLLSNDLHQIIYVTDRVLMGFLDIYINVISDYGNESGISNYLGKNT